MENNGITDMCGNITNSVSELAKGIMNMVTTPMTVIEFVMNAVQDSCQK